MVTNWKPRIELSTAEKFIAKRCGKRRGFVFLREIRHRIFDDELQGKLATAYTEAKGGKDPVPPAQLAMAVLLQAMLNVPDHEVVELTVMDRRWQMVLDCHGADEPPFAQGTFFNFRERMIEHGLDAVLFEKTVQLARETKGYSATHLRAAFDASPLYGAGRVEDTFNLIGRAALHVVRSAATRLGRSVEDVAKEAGIPVVAATSIKAGLDLDWDDPNARNKGLQQLLGQVRSLGAWLERELKEQAQEPPLREQWDLVQRLIAQDTEPDPDPDGDGRRITQGVAKDRRISIGDPDMRHGRKTKRKRIDGYKRHIAIDLDTPGLVCAVALTPANQPERAAAKDLLQDISRTYPALKDLYIDRGYLGDETIEAQRAKGLRVHCRPYPLRNGDRFDKGDFEIDLEAQSVRCPDGAVVSLKLGAVLHFPAERCCACVRRAQCTRAKDGRGRSLSIHPQEPFHLNLRRRAKTPEGRQDLRERIAVEHALAAIHNHQGDRARYRSLRKNLFDLRRHAALKNLSVVDRLRDAA